jgi:hypothetical protein
MCSKKKFKFFGVKPILSIYSICVESKNKRKSPITCYTSMILLKRRKEKKSWSSFYLPHIKHGKVYWFCVERNEEQKAFQIPSYLCNHQQHEISKR